jgi:protein O-GlcNAc transferase
VYESLALGMPVVTQPSQMLRGRIALGCYRKMGMMDCVAESPEEYADIAVRLATQPAFHDSVKSRILASCHVLFEDREAVSQLETFLHGVLQTGAVPS